MNHRAPSGFTLIELLIVVGIICLLIQILVPAVMSAQEAARRTQCENNMRQIGLAVMHHHDSVGHYPTGGWGPLWQGDPVRGRGKDQPGSWIFNVLDFLDQNSVRSMTAGKTGMEKAEAIVQMVGTPISLFACPDRRKAMPLPVSPRHLKTNDEFMLLIPLAARSDYAINTGDYGGGQPGSWYPKKLEQVQQPGFKWYDTSKFTGISFGRSEIRMKDVTDGTSKTYMIGEKYMPVSEYLTGKDKGDDESMYSGFDDDNGRSASKPPPPDALQEHHSSFGSAHPGCWLAVFCDGSVHIMSFTIDADIHKRLANRADGQEVGGNY
jgi:prepilin-type N-terminal cleavage/methylation domain-containing protein